MLYMGKIQRQEIQTGWDAHSHFSPTLPLASMFLILMDKEDFRKVNEGSSLPSKRLGSDLIAKILNARKTLN